MLKKSHSENEQLQIKTQSLRLSNELASKTLDEFKIKMERILFENQELNILNDSLKEEVEKKTNEWVELQTKLARLEKVHDEEEKEKRKEEKLKLMMADYTVTTF